MPKVLMLVLKILGGIVALAVVVSIVSRVLSAGVLKKGRELVIGKVDLTSLPDGTYRGTYSLGRFTNSVEVDVAGHRITAIRIVKRIPFAPGDLPKQLTDRVIEKQSLAVDTVSGATITTKAYLKSIENALQPK